MRIKPVHVLVAILAIATLYFYQDPQSNGNSRLAVVRAVVEHGSLQIDSYLQQASWASVDKAYYNGHYYGDKGIGSSLVAVPLYFIIYQVAALLHSRLDNEFIKHVLTALVMGGAFIITGVLLYRIARLITENRWKAMLAALGISLGTMLWPYSVVYYGHVLAALFLTIAFYLLFTQRLTDNGPRISRFLWAGLAMGFAFITDYTPALIILGLLLYTVFFLWGQRLSAIARSALAGMLGAAIPLGIMLLYNFLVYGSPFRLGYGYEATPLCTNPTGFMGFNSPSLTALFHISVDPRFGLFWQSPVLLLSFIGYAVALQTRRLRAEALLSFYALASLLLMDASFCYWWGGSAFGPRYLIVALPFFIIPLTLIPDRVTWLLGGLTALSAGQMLIPLLGKIQIGLDYDARTDQFSVNQPFTGFSILYQYGIPIIIKLHRKDTLPWTLGSAVGLAYRYSAALLVLVEAVLVGLLYKVTRTNNPAQKENF